MLVSKVYGVLDSLVVEVSCIHSGDPGASHLVIREERRPADGSMRYALRALADVADTAGHLMAAGWREDCPTGLEDCCEV